MDKRVLLMFVLTVHASCIATTTTTTTTPRPFNYQDDASLQANLVEAGAAIGFTVGGPVGAVVGGIIGFFACHFFCPSQDPPDTIPPTIICPTVNSPVYTPASSRTAVVTYPDAQASDNEGVDRGRGGQFIPTNLQSGSNFPVGIHTIAFIAYDTSGNSNMCQFSFTVEARECDYPARPDDGDVVCPDTPPGLLPVYGESCTYNCDIGYNLIGMAEQTCGTLGDWPGGGSITCQIKTCPSPTAPDNALTDTCTADYNYDSVCVFICLNGFALHAGADRSIQCGEDENWIGTPESCIDSESPVIENCPETQTVYVGASVDYADASWDVPSGTDNHDEVVVVTLVEGLNPGSQFPVEPNNVYLIVYGAQDSAGNVAVDCEFSIIVQEITCPPIQHSFRLNITCPTRLRYGARCAFQCDTGYPLIGPTEVYCEVEADDPSAGFWNWGHNMTSPSCEVVLCPTLRPPDNGALSCGSWINGIYCTMACNSQYDIPRTAATDGEFVCADTEGVWRPHDNVPDCSVTRRGDSMRLPSELFYFSGDCRSAEAQQEIKEDFIAQLSQSDYRELCTLYPDCSVENVNVTCGAITRKKRDIYNTDKTRIRRDIDQYDYEALVVFDFVLDNVYNPDMTAAEMDDNSYNQFGSLTDYFEELVNNGGMDLTGLEVIADSFRFAESLIVCDLGSTAEYSTFTCRPCSTGTHYNVEYDNCTYCPIGLYQDTDGAMNCIECAASHSTKQIGSRNEEDCIPMCQAGSYSTDGLQPCAPCPINKYSHNEMQEYCMDCPPGSNTTNVGAESILDCTTEIIPGGPCSTNPCNSHGVCVRRDSSYECHCSGGYSGNNCDVPPDPCDINDCRNGVTCVSGVEENNYLCECLDMYVGELCQHHKVNGEWGEWGQWSDCSATCGDGEQSRYRRCDSPSPNTYGDYCQHTNFTTQECNIEDCPECGELDRPPYGTRLDCGQNGDTTTCVISCRPGRTTTQSYPSALTCGPDTNHMWSPNVAYNDLPKCSESRFTTHLRQSIDVEFDGPDPSEEEEDEIRDNMVAAAAQQAECIDTDQCTIQVDVSTDNNRRKKRTGTVIVSIIIEADLEAYDYLQDGVFDNDTAAEALVNLAWFVTQIEGFALAINESAHNGTLTITINSEEYAANSESIVIDGEMECSPGQTLHYMICINCPPGSYGDGVECTLCGLGEYQEDEGQTNCDVCADGYTTSSLGSSNATDCILDTDDSGDDDEDSDEIDNDDDSDEDENIGNTNNQSGKQKDESGTSTATISVVAAVVSVVVIAVVVVVVVLIIIKKKKNNGKLGPSRRNSVVLPYGPRSDSLLTARDVNVEKMLPPPSYEQSVSSRELDDNLINVKRHQSLPPLDHAYTKQMLNRRLEPIEPHGVDRVNKDTLLY